MRFVGVGLIALGATLVSSCEKMRDAQAEARLVQEAQASVTMLLRDPASATFQDIEVRDSAVCGLVNGRNGFGGYAQPMKFVVESGVATVDPSTSAEAPRVKAPLQCAFDVDYRRCRGEKMLPTSTSRCLLGVSVIGVEEVRTAQEAKETCAKAIGQRFNEDVRAGSVRALRQNARQAGDEWIVRTQWEASGEDFSRIRSASTCMVKPTGKVVIWTLFDD